MRESLFRGEQGQSLGLLVLLSFVLVVAPVHAEYIVPIAGHSPQVLISLTTERDPHDTNFSIVNSTTISASKTMPVGTTPHYEVATWDTGAPVHILSREAFEDFDLAGAGKTGLFPTLVNGVEAIASDPLGIYTGGFGSVTATTPSLMVDTSSFRGQYNTSVLYAPAGESLPTIVGTPLSSQYTAVFDYADPKIVTIDGQEYRSPEVTIASFDALPDPTRRLQLDVAAGALGDPPSFFPSLLNFEDFGDDPLIPTLGPSYYLDANISHDAYNRNLLDVMYDSGSQGTFVSEQVAATLGFDVINDAPDFVVRLQTVSGTTDAVPGFFADQLELPGTDGGMVLSEVPLIVFNLPDPRAPGNVLQGLIGQNVFGDRTVTLDPEPAYMLGDPGPFLGVSDQALDNHNWSSTVTSASFNNPASWTSPGTPELDWIAHVENNAAFDQTAVVGSDASVSALNIVGDAEKMTVSVDASVTLTVFGTIIVTDNGELHIGGGAVAPLAVELRGGLLTGNGDVGGEVISQALIAPGDSAGVLHFLGNFDQLDEGALEMELRGTDNSDPLHPQYDALEIDGMATLAGALDLTIDGGYSPTPGDSMAIIEALGGVSGIFDEIDGVVLGGGGMGLAVTYRLDDVIVTVATLGDTDLDLDVDFDDFNDLANNYTGPLNPGIGGKDWGLGDFDGDGDVDFTDFNYLANNYTGSLGGAKAVPEPCAFILLGMGAVGLLACAGRTRQRS